MHTALLGQGSSPLPHRKFKLAVLGGGGRQAGPGESGVQGNLKVEQERGESFGRNERLCPWGLIA